MRDQKGASGRFPRRTPRPWRGREAPPVPERPVISDTPLASACASLQSARETCHWHVSFRSSDQPSLPPATRPKAFTIRLLHRISTRKINVLSPKILPGAVKFPCATHLAPANLSLPHRIARHRTGATASGRLRAGRPGASPVRNPESARTSADAKGLTTSASAGKRSKRLRRVFGLPWQQGVARLSGCGTPGNGPDPSGRRQGGRKTRARTASEHLAPFLIQRPRKRNGTRQR